MTHDTEYGLISGNNHSFSALVSALLTRERPLVLVGMSGAGKSMLSQQLSALSGLNYYDTDCVIVERLGMSIAQYFATEGVAAFRVVESEVIRAIVGHGTAILAIGAGAFINAELRDFLLEETDCVYIDVPANELWQRIKGHIATLPMLNTEDPCGTFDELYRVRAPIYAEAPIHLKWQSENLIEMAMQIKNIVLAHFESNSS